MIAIQILLAIICATYLVIAILFLIALTYLAVKDEEMSFLASEPRTALLLTLFIFFGSIGWLGIVLSSEETD